MKVFSIFLLIALFALMESNLDGFSTKYCSTYNGILPENQAYSRGFCRSLYLDDGYAQCCYVKYKIGESTYYNCVQLTLADYYDIDAAKDRLESGNSGWDIKSIECTSSSYLYGSFLLLLFILF